MNKKLKVAFLDIVGTQYTGDTLKSKGIGGSEAAVISMASELSDLGVDVSVFNDCGEEGNYGGVNYYTRDNKKAQNQKFDVLVCSRTFIPFYPMQYKNAIYEQTKINIETYATIVSNSKYKIVWCHDMGASGEESMEFLLNQGLIDEVFVMSDFQYNLYLNKKDMNFEVLKHKFFQTRNGIRSFDNNVDITKKDKNLFVFNAAYLKGMEPLLSTVWPLLKKELPDAKLIVMGGYYATGAEKTQLQKQYELKRKAFEGILDIHFTGIIPQREVADILTKASYFIYPNTYQEIFGISVTEAINYNVPLIGHRFGALEEIAAEPTSYLINYSYDKFIEQPYRLVEAAVFAYKNDKIREDKMLACNLFKPYLGWDMVALQWKRHFYKKFEMEFPEDEEITFRDFIIHIITLYNKKIINAEELDFLVNLNLSNK